MVMYRSGSVAGLRSYGARLRLPRAMHRRREQPVATQRQPPGMHGTQRASTASRGPCSWTWLSASSSRRSARLMALGRCVIRKTVLPLALNSRTPAYQGGPPTSSRLADNVEHDQRRLTIDGTRQADALALAAREHATRRRRWGVVALGKAQDHVVQAGASGRRQSPCLSRPRQSERCSRRWCRRRARCPSGR